MKRTTSQKSILLIILLCAPLIGMGIDLYTPSLPAITNYFQTTKVLVRYTLITYLIGYGVGQVLFGPISDAIGRRKLFILGLLIYVVVSLLIVLSPNITYLLIMRIIQGLAVSIFAVLVKAILADAFEGKAMQKVSGEMMFAWSIGPIIAPAIGAYIQHHLGWRYCFVFLAIYGFVMLCLAIKFLPETLKEKRPLKLKSIAFDYQQILSSKIFLGIVFVMILSYSFSIVFNVIGPFLVQGALHYSVVAYGYIALLLGFAFLIATLINRSLTHYLEAKTIILLASLLLCVSVLVMLLLALANIFNLYALIIPVFFILFATAFILPNCMHLGLSLFPKMAGLVSAAMGTLMMCSTALLSAAASHLKAVNALPLSFTYLLFALLAVSVFALIQKSVKP